jgi:hypothetical protein
MSIPASQLVRIVPGVLGAGGSGLALNGMILTNNSALPAGAPRLFSSPAEVAGVFGITSTEAAMADVYFTGYEGSTQRPAGLWFAYYDTGAPVTPTFDVPPEVDISLALGQGTGSTGVLVFQVSNVPPGGTVLWSLTGVTTLNGTIAIDPTTATSEEVAIDLTDTIVTPFADCMTVNCVVTAPSGVTTLTQAVSSVSSGVSIIELSPPDYLNSVSISNPPQTMSYIATAPSGSTFSWGVSDGADVTGGNVVIDGDPTAQTVTADWSGGVTATPGADFFDLSCAVTFGENVYNLLSQIAGTA